MKNRLIIAAMLAGLAGPLTGLAGRISFRGPTPPRAVRGKAKDRPRGYPGAKLARKAESQVLTFHHGA
jgi:hypothetical protein